MKNIQTESSKKHILTKDGENIEIPVLGSLGLLALGYRGIEAWREKRDIAIKQNLKDQENSKTEE